ncbi:MAG: hypothetical protein LC772_08970 [Chloroflexi bacterium]|nr:hypothetical protein [Chloroflexota bacterium]
MMCCQRCNKPMKERLVSDEFSGREYEVTVTGIPGAVCSYCGQHAVVDDAIDEIEMFLRPLLEGGVGMRLLRSSHLNIDLGNSLHPSAIDLAGPYVPAQPARRQSRLPRPADAGAELAVSTVALAEEAA